MAILVLDPMHEAEVRRLWPGLDDDRYTEVWEGTTVMSPIATNEHQNLANDLGGVLWLVIGNPKLGLVQQGVNLTDRAVGWTQNYRVPDVTVFLTGNPAVDLGTHYRGGPDFLIEIVSPGETPAAKLPFYESIGTREVLIIHRDPWRLELFALANGKLGPAGTADLAAGGVCASAALGLTFALTSGTPRPRVAVTHPATGGDWSI